MNDRILLCAVGLIAVLALGANLLVVREVGLARERRRAEGPPSNSANRCAVCEYMVSMAYDYTEEQHTEEQLEMILEKACEILPPEYRDDCNAIIDERLPELIEMIVQKVPVDKTCQLLGECPR